MLAALGRLMEAGRVSGVNENITILLMAAKFQIPV
jgi:hypothetical protein